MTGSNAIFRRAALKGLAAAFGLAAGGRLLSARADEAPKIKKADAKYQDRPKGQQRCEICLQFQPPSACKIVQGPISPKGWCQFFAAKENAH